MGWAPFTLYYPKCYYRILYYIFQTMLNQELEEPVKFVGVFFF